MAKLTKRTVAEIAAEPARDVLVWDEELRGFGLRVKPSGVRTYCVQYRNAERRSKRMLVGRHGVLTPDEARRRAREVLGRVAGGADPAEELRAERVAASMNAARNDHTLASLAERYLREHAETKKKPTSVASDRMLLRLHVLPRFGSRPVADVSREEIGQLHHSLRETPYGANRVLALLSKMFNLAERWGLRADSSNPCRHVERYREQKRERFLSVAELACLGDVLSALERSGDEPCEVVAAIRLLILTGARRGEILGLRWEMIDFERGVIRLPDSKTGRKPIPLNAPALEILSHLPRRSVWVLPTAEGSTPVSLSKPWERVRKRLDMPELRVHDLRHSAASVMASAGASLLLIGRILGHSSPSTTARYAHLFDDPVRELSENMGARIAAYMSGGKPSSVVPLRSEEERTRN